jgi:hypothetical protein
MADAPHDGTVIDALVDGEWIPVYWTDHANDMSPYGTTGWAQASDGLHIIDVEGWRDADTNEVIDDASERRAAAAQAEAARIEDEAVERRRVSAERRERTRQTRALLEDRLAAHTGAPAPHLRMVELRRTVRDLDRQRALETLSRVLANLRS